LDGGILIKFQNKGFATLALNQLLSKAKESGRWGVIHAMTNVNNIASNKLCERVGFQFLEEIEMEYDGCMLPAKHYTFDSTA
jgi:RimJ/RimL family protein N-acetyltransferase